MVALGKTELKDSPLAGCPGLLRAIPGGKRQGFVTVAADKEEAATAWLKKQGRKIANVRASKKVKDARFIRFTPGYGGVAEKAAPAKKARAAKSAKPANGKTNGPGNKVPF